MSATVAPGAPEERDARHVAPLTPSPSERASCLDTSLVLPVQEESVAVSKRRVITGKVRVSTRTVTADETAEIALERSRVDVIRVPMERVVEVAPEMRVEGDTTIIPVIEERLVVMRQLVLIEEVRIRRRVVQDVARQRVTLRKQLVVVERLDPEGHASGADPEAGSSSLNR